MSLDRLRAHYGFSRQPFGRDLAPNLLFASRAHQQAVARLRWLAGERGIGVLTGETGAGKTVAARAATAALDASRHTIVYLPNPAIGSRGLHMHLVYALGATPRFHTAALINQTADLLAAETDEKNKTVLVVCDEAHLLTPDQLEQLRLLTNADMDLLTELETVSFSSSSLTSARLVMVPGHGRTRRAAPGSGRSGRSSAGVVGRYGGSLGALSAG